MPKVFFFITLQNLNLAQIALQPVIRWTATNFLQLLLEFDTWPSQQLPYSPDLLGNLLLAFLYSFTNSILSPDIIIWLCLFLNFMKVEPYHVCYFVYDSFAQYYFVIFNYVTAWAMVCSFSLLFSIPFYDYNPVYPFCWWIGGCFQFGVIVTLLWMFLYITYCTGAYI